GCPGCRCSSPRPPQTPADARRMPARRGCPHRPSSRPRGLRGWPGCHPGIGAWINPPGPRPSPASASSRSRDRSRSLPRSASRSPRGSGREASRPAASRNADTWAASFVLQPANTAEIPGIPGTPILVDLDPGHRRIILGETGDGSLTGPGLSAHPDPVRDLRTPFLFGLRLGSLRGHQLESDLLEDLPVLLAQGRNGLHRKPHGLAAIPHRDRNPGLHRLLRIRGMKHRIEGAVDLMNHLLELRDLLLAGFPLGLDLGGDPFAALKGRLRGRYLHLAVLRRDDGMVVHRAFIGTLGALVAAA